MFFAFYNTVNYNYGLPVGHCKNVHLTILMIQNGDIF